MHAFSRNTITYILSCIHTVVYTVMYKVALVMFLIVEYVGFERNGNLILLCFAVSILIKYVHFACRYRVH
jgi:hypothetical protein